jgi:hypothetical protein
MAAMVEEEEEVIVVIGFVCFGCALWRLGSDTI